MEEEENANVNVKQYFENVSGTSNPMTRATPAYAPYTSTVGYRDLGGTTKYMDPALMKRPARKQVSSRSYIEIHPSDGQDYNIWYHKRPGFKKDRFEDRENAGSRCDVLSDTGKTKAGKNSQFCVYFAHGRCAQGHECVYHHRIPTFEDEDKLDLGHDIFGRERHSTDRDDMSGVGNFTRECRTLYIGCVKMNAGGNIDASVKRHFEEWGPIEYSRVIHTKSIAFVRYYMRASAEFAKEAMDNQSLDNDDILMIRWATDDTNPIAKEYEEKRTHRVATEAVTKRIKLMNQDDQATMYYQLTGEYPDTNPQFSQHTNDPSNLSYDYMYPTADVPVQHPYINMTARRNASKQKAAGGGAGAQSASTTAAANDSSYSAYNYSDPSNPYAHYYQQYGYDPAYAQYYQQQYSAEVSSEFVPTYKTAERELAKLDKDDEGDEEDEEVAEGQNLAGGNGEVQTTNGTGEWTNMGWVNHGGDSGQTNAFYGNNEPLSFDNTKLPGNDEPLSFNTKNTNSHNNTNTKHTDNHNNTNSTNSDNNNIKDNSNNSTDNSKDNRDTDETPNSTNTDNTNNSENHSDNNNNYNNTDNTINTNTNTFDIDNNSENNNGNNSNDNNNDSNNNDNNNDSNNNDNNNSDNKDNSNNNNNNNDNNNSSNNNNGDGDIDLNRDLEELDNKDDVSMYFANDENE